MNFIIRAFLLVTITSSTIACGGGGGDGDDATNISGVWSGALTKISDGCVANSPQTITVRHTVSQNEDAVILGAESGFQFVGNTVGENGFSVDATHDTVGTTSCADTSRIAYDSINDDTDPTADVDLSINRSCEGNATCQINYTGTVSRTGTNVTPPTPDASPTVGAGTTPIAGGCSAINPATAAGTFGGDGGCGISSVSYTHQSGTVILEPFGSNGATSFSVAATDPSSARSSRNDLTVKGEVGYNCSLACSPPSTFTVQCFKEGGTTCVEKF